MDLYEAIRRRRDTRHFTDEAVPAAVLEQALEAAISAPSVGLSQPWRFLDISALNRQYLVQNFLNQRASAEDSLSDPQRLQQHQTLKLEALREAPVLLAAFCAYPDSADYTIGVIGSPRALEWSCACAIQNLWLALTAEGYGAGWVTILDFRALAHYLSVPSSWQALGILCIGRPASDYGQRPMLEAEGWKRAERAVEHFYWAVGERAGSERLSPPHQGT